MQNQKGELVSKISGMSSQNFETIVTNHITVKQLERIIGQVVEATTTKTEIGLKYHQKLLKELIATIMDECNTANSNPNFVIDFISVKCKKTGMQIKLHFSSGYQLLIPLGFGGPENIQSK